MVNMAESHRIYHADEVLKQSRDAVAGVWTDVRSFDFKWIVPYETAFSPKILSNTTTWVMLLFGFAPLLGFYVAHNMFQLLGWLLTYFALAWAAYFYLVVAKRDFDLRIGLAVAIFTVFVGCQMDIWSKQVPPMSWLYAAAGARDGVSSALAFIAGVGVNEEFWKALPVLVLAFGFGRIRKPLDGLSYGALSGLGFAVREGFKYIGGASDANDLLRQALIRTTTNPFLHATWTAVAGYFIGLAVVSRDRRAALCIVGIVPAATLHGWYDFAVQRAYAVAIAAVAYLLLIAYIDRSQQMVDQVHGGAPAPAAPAARPAPTG